MNDSLISLPFTVSKGHRVASGLAINTPYPAGTISLQTPYFKAQGLDLSSYYHGTINAGILCKAVSLIKWDYEFKEVSWLESLPSEDFRFAHCSVKYKSKIYNALIYQPTLETKIAHLQNKNVLEILCEPIAGLAYDDKANLLISKSYLAIEY